MSVEIARRTRACWMRIRRYSWELYDQPKVALSLKTRMVRAEAIEVLLYGCSTSTLRQEHYAKLCTVHRRVLLRIIGAQRKRSDHRMTSYNRALEITRCESTETTLRIWCLLTEFLPTLSTQQPKTVQSSSALCTQHSTTICRSGLSGGVQVVMYSYSWVRIPRWSLLL